MGCISNTMAMLRVKWQTMRTRVKIPKEEDDLRYCYEVLEAVSRSFTVVIQQLTDRDLRDAICIFYLVLRALDTIEDDMSVTVETKLESLPKFHTHLHEPEWTMTGVGEGRERELLENYPRVTREFKKLRKQYQGVIEDICERMANGMCEFLQRPVVTKDDYNLYCHYVAGLVGHGLVRLFAQSGFEDPRVADDLTNANHMGLFLQKTNIIRDYFEDIVEEPPRMFWPKEVWGKYAADLKDLKAPGNEVNALNCLNELVADAMTHLPYVVEFMAALKEPSIFRFCAIPQVMAIATLTEVYNNYDTYHIKVKLAKADACHIMLDSTDLYNTLVQMNKYCDAMEQKCQQAGTGEKEQMQENIAESRRVMKSYMSSSAPEPYARSLMYQYPGLGGRFLLGIVDSVSSFFSGGERTPQLQDGRSSPEAPPKTE